MEDTVSYRCDICDEPRQGQPLRTPKSFRRVEYPERSYRHKRQRVLDPGGIGYEVTGELCVCEECMLSVVLPRVQQGMTLNGIGVRG